MPESKSVTLPRSQYTALRLPDGTHSGVCVDVSRLVLEIQRKGVRYYFDLAMMYNAQHEQHGVDNITAEARRLILGV